LELRHHHAGIGMTLTARVAALLVVPPLMWACNAVVGRLLADSMPPLLLNALRWWTALLVLLPLGWGAVSTRQRRAQIRQRWRPLAALGLLGVGAYNALQYQALQTSTPINVTLIASSTPLWMLLIGALFHGERVRPAQTVGAALSMAGVLVVLVRGNLAGLSALQLVAGDLWMLLAALSWAVYSWMLAKPAPGLAGDQRPTWTWSEFLLIQALFGIVWATVAAAGETALVHHRFDPSPGVLAALAFVALGPSILAYRCWGLGVAAVGPALAGFFGNLTPLFAALLSALWLGQPPQPYHAAAFALIVAGIAASNRR
jgi:drug/metabolite transporter (DMT)-like permease